MFKNPRGIKAAFTAVTIGLVLTGSAFAAMTVDDVVKLSKGGISPNIIISQIKKDSTKFNLSVDDLLKLKQAGVSDAVVNAMVAGPAAAATASNAPAPAAAPAEPDLEMGVYYNKDGKWVELVPEVVNRKTGGVLKSIATNGIIKGDVNGNIQGAHSANALHTPLEFRVVAAEGVAVTEYQLIHLRENKNDREFRTVTGGVFHSSSGTNRDLAEFNGKRVARRTFDVTVGDSVRSGEFGFLPPGAMATANGASLGKMYTFRVLE